MSARAPTSSRSHGDACEPESVGDGLCVDPEPLGDVGKRPSARVLLGSFLQDLVVPCRLFATARDTVAVEVAGHGGAVDVELDGSWLMVAPAR